MSSMLRVRELRQSWQLTQIELSKAIGVTQLAISNWEQGKHSISVENLEKLSLYFGVSIPYILGITKKKGVNNNSVKKVYDLSDLVRFQLRLTELRRDKALTKAELGKKLGTSEETISNWESGRSEPPILILLRLSDFYQVSLPYLLGISNEKEEVT